jgi:hypothetical protein
MNKLIFRLSFFCLLFLGACRTYQIHSGDEHTKSDKKEKQTQTVFVPGKNKLDIRIPVVVHVVLADQWLLSDDCIKEELKDLTTDFLCLNPDTTMVYEGYMKRIGNPHITFYLDEKIGEKGIIRVKSGTTKNFYKYSTIVEPETHLNVYIGDLKSSDGFVYSYSYLNPESDAVFLRYEWVGGHYRLLTHETGHWLGLWHVFEGGCDDNDCGDEVADTPPQKGSSYKNEDQTNNPADYKNGCGGSVPMYNNFMDYSNFRRMFTKGQVERMYEALANHRKKIWNAANPPAPAQ